MCNLAAGTDTDAVDIMPKLIIQLGRGLRLYFQIKVWVVVGLIFVLPSCATTKALDNWAGKYRYTAYGGQTQAGTTIVVDYHLSLQPNQAGESCTFIASGYQTDESIICDTTSTADRIAIHFKTYRNGSLTNKYSVAVYQPGQVLFTLQKQSGVPVLLTEFEALQVVDINDLDGAQKFAKQQQ